jgi:hypothetical protein
MDDFDLYFDLDYDVGGYNSSWYDPLDDKENWDDEYDDDDEFEDDLDMIKDNQIDPLYLYEEDDVLDDFDEDDEFENDWEEFGDDADFYG